MDPPPHGDGLRDDVLLLAFLLALHAMPLVALAAGHSWGAGADGYATAVVFLGTRELAHELRARRGSRGGASAGRS
ncbi:MAG TPA: hypothetical protein VFK85_11175 [Anaeromyxobacteraceae bacterium]|nr:hypothetical protein [Anaeromyxobacteraceae bacterium]